MFIIAIIIAVTVPSFVRSYNAEVLNATGRTIATSCEFAKLNAVLHQQKVAFYIDMDKQTIWLMQFATPANRRRRVGGANPARQSTISPRIGLLSAQLGDQPVATEGAGRGHVLPERHVRRLCGDASWRRKGEWPGGRG